jgi:PAS domain S-box-containing protein
VPSRAKARTRSRILPHSRQDDLLKRLKTAEESLRALPSADLDGLVVFGRRGAQVVTLQGGETAYRLLVDAMSEGAATVSSEGAILYCNRRLAELVSLSAAKLVGAQIHSLIEQSEQARVDRFLRSARRQVVKQEFTLRTRRGRSIPVYLSLSPLRGYRGHAFGMVVTDLTEQRRKQQEEVKHTEAQHRLLLERELAALVGLRGLEDSNDIGDCRTLGQKMREITAQAIDEIGRLARGLHPTALDDHGLDAALSRYVAEYSKTHKIPVELKLGRLNCSKLPAPVQTALYRILQEALTNVVRHAGAKSARMAFKHTARTLEVSVADDGKGFDIGAVTSSNRLGLQSIRERAAMLGGKATFDSGASGTRVLVQIPLADWEFPA